MKKYAIHFIYIIVIVALAVMSRMKTNALSDELEEAKALATVSQNEAERAMEMARAASQEAEKQAALAQQQVLEARKALENCK